MVKYALPSVVVRYCCVGERGESGAVISNKPFSIKGKSLALRTPSLEERRDTSEWLFYFLVLYKNPKGLARCRQAGGLALLLAR